MAEENPVMTGLNIFRRLERKHYTFINVFFDYWKGSWRFIYDTEEVRKCNNACQRCPLFFLLRNERDENGFSARLHPATKDDLSFYGVQNFVNCKTFEQYRDCYAGYLAKRTDTDDKKTEEEKIRKELDLLKKCRIIYCKETSDLSNREREFRMSVLQKIEQLADAHKKTLIFHLWNESSRNPSSQK